MGCIPMEDKEIVQLYLDRSELAIVETSAKYENYCTISVSYGVVPQQQSVQDNTAAVMIHNTDCFFITQPLTVVLCFFSL